MNFAPETLVCLALATPLVGMFFIALFHKQPNLREGATILTTVTLFVFVVQLYPYVTAENPLPIEVNLIPVMANVWIKFHVEPLGMVYALVASFLWILNSIYSIGYMRGNHEKHQTRFYLCFPAAIFSAIGIAFAGNLFTLFIFYEMLTLSTYPLVTHKGTPEAIRAGRTYLGILLTTSICLQLFALLWIQALTTTPLDPADPSAGMVVKSLDFVAGGIFHDGYASGAISASLLGFLFFLYIYGIGKAALMPLHKWLPAAMVAPTPVSAFLHAVAVVKAGVFCVVKIIVYTFGINTMREAMQGEWLMYVSGCTIIVASMIALYQDNLKRRLAYSTISQLSYVILGASLMTPLAIMGATLHIIMHAVGKITLFFAAGSIYTASHKTKISQLDGIGRRMPWTMAAFSIASLSMLGIPPTAGFVSKFFLLSGSWELFSKGFEVKYLFPVIVFITSTILSSAYFLPIIYRAWFKPLSAEDAAHPHGEAPWPIVLALSCTAALTLALFFYPLPALKLAQALKEAIQ